MNDRLPERIYVYQEDEGIFITCETIDELPESERGSLIGTYDKVDENTLQIKKGLG